MHGLSKGVIYMPCNKTIDTLGATQIFIDHVWKQFGLPDVIISDRGPQFTSKVFQEICQHLGINHRMSTAYHPQTDGETERVNQELETYLRIYCTTEPRNWSAYLPITEFAHNNRAHEMLKMSPFQIILGSDPKGLLTVYSRIKAPTVEHRLNEIVKIRQEALAAHELARQTMLRRNTKTFVPFKLGDKVWLEARNLRIPYESRKLAPKQEGPFKIKKVLGHTVYTLELPHQWRIHPIFHASLLTHYHETGEHGLNYTAPPPDLIDGWEEYKIENILTHKMKGNQWQYLIKWKGYGSNKNTWEPEKNLSNLLEMLEMYKETHGL